MNGYYKLVIAKLKDHGYRFIKSGKGSHEHWTNTSRIQILSKNMQSRDMANEIMKQAGINHRF